LLRLKAVPSSLHQKIRFPTNFGVMEIKGDQVASKQCIMAAIKQHPPGAKQKGKIAAECSKGLWQLEDGEDACPERSNESCEPCKELELIAFSLDPEKYFQVGHSLDATK
jgi:hypothetical protein